MIFGRRPAAIAMPPLPYGNSHLLNTHRYQPTDASCIRRKDSRASVSDPRNGDSNPGRHDPAPLLKPHWAGARRYSTPAVGGPPRPTPHAPMCSPDPSRRRRDALDAVRDRTAEADAAPVRDVPAGADYSRCGAVVFGCRENPGRRWVPRDDHGRFRRFAQPTVTPGHRAQH
jgi:hypothetical protein